MPTLTDADPAIPALPALPKEAMLKLIEEHLGLMPRRDDTVVDNNTGRWTDAARYYDLMTAAIAAADRASRVQGEAVGEVQEIDTDDDGCVSAWIALHQPVELGTLLYTAPQAETLAVAGFVLVPREPTLGSHAVNEACWGWAEAMPHTYSAAVWNSLKPAVYAAINKFIATVEKERAAAPTPTASIAAEAPVSVPDGFWLAPMNLDDEAHEAAEGQDDAFPLAGVRSWYAARDSWLARHPGASNSTALAAPKAEGEPHYLWSHPREAPRVCRPSDATFAVGAPDWVREYPVEVYGGAPLAKVDAQVAGGEAMDAEAYAELFRLREAVKGPSGFATWQDAAVDERIRRVKAERALAAAAPVAQAAVGADTTYPWQVLEMAKRVIEAYRSGSDGELSEAVKYLEVAALKATAQSSAAREVLAERQRQISAEGWNPAHDDEHDDGSLARAAACYALHTEPVGNVGDYLRFWPWDSDAWKPKGRRRNLIRAGALIIAEIERLDRATPHPEATAVAPVAGEVKP